MLKIASFGLLNAQIARIVIMEALFFIWAVAWHRSHRARHGALARIAGASFGTLPGRRRGRLVGGAGTILPGCLAQEQLVLPAQVQPC